MQQRSFAEVEREGKRKVTQSGRLLGDAGYRGVDKRPENRGRAVPWEVALRPGRRRVLPNNRAGRQAERIEQLKARVRALVEHPLHWIKKIFGLKKVRYGGLAKSTAQWFTLFGLANLMIAKRWLLAP
jgi:IS5 family transposase